MIGGLAKRLLLTLIFFTVYAMVVLCVMMRGMKVISTIGHVLEAAVCAVAVVWMLWCAWRGLYWYLEGDVWAGWFASIVASPSAVVLGLETVKQTRRLAAIEVRRYELRVRAEAQHLAVMLGDDDYGVFGEYRPGET